MSQLRNAQGEGAGSTGGFLVPPGFRQKLVDRLKAYGGVASPLRRSPPRPVTRWNGRP